MTDRQAFLSIVRTALGRPDGRTASPPAPQAADLVARDAEAVRRTMREEAKALLDEMARSAAAAAWRVVRVASPEDAAEAVLDICRASGVRTALRSAHPVFERSPVEATLAAAGIELGLMARPVGAADADAARLELKGRAFSADAGITGVDYAVAETGTVVLHPRRGVSRLVSLAPPRHIAILELGDVLPSLDELFTLEAEALAKGELAGSMNLISGPSRTGDIEATIIEGVHGPVEAHLVVVG